MIIVSVVGLCLAVAGFIGYKNKTTIASTITWNGLKLYTTLKDYYETFQEGFCVIKILLKHDTSRITVPINKWDEADVYLMGILPTDDQRKHCLSVYPELSTDKKFTYGSLGMSYILDGKSYYNIYVCDDNGMEKYTNDVKNLKERTFEVDNIQRILSATHYNGHEIEDITELLQAFNISGDFFDKNDTFTFTDIVHWYYSLNESSNTFYKTLDSVYVGRYNSDQYIEIIDICGDCLMFHVNDVITFTSE